jgi:shikimate dehydrogenase
VPGAFDVVVNATASSLAGDAVPVNARVLRPGALAVDMMYGPAAAGFMAWAEAHGAVARDGLGMLVEQAAESFEIWRGVRPPSAQVLAEVRASLAAGRMKPCCASSPASWWRAWRWSCSSWRASRPWP